MSEGNVKITSSGADYLSRVSEAMGRIFATDPGVNYMLCNLPFKERAAYLPEYIHTLLYAAALNGGVFQEIGDWRCMAVWMPPGRKLDGVGTIVRCGLLKTVMRLGIGGMKRMMVDFVEKTNAHKKQAMKGRKRFHYLFFIGTEQEARGQGLASKIIQEYQKRTEADGLPIWLEASTAHSRDVYARVGFELVGEINMGVGTHAASGDKEAGGPGVTIYPMIWWPKGSGRNGVGTSQNGVPPGGTQAQ